MCLNVVQQFKMFKKAECIQNVQTCSKAIELFKDAKNQKNEYARHRKSYATYFQGGVTLWICMELYIFCTLRICMKIHVFPMWRPLDLYGNINVLQGCTLGIYMKIRVFPRVVSFGFPIELYIQT